MLSIALNIYKYLESLEFIFFTDSSIHNYFQIAKWFSYPSVHYSIYLLSWNPTEGRAYCFQMCNDFHNIMLEIEFFDIKLKNPFSIYIVRVFPKVTFLELI